jgi:thioredoxin reductase (NADPH)
MADRRHSTMREKVIVIGSGPAGLTAAIYLARANLTPMLFEGFMAGGIPGGQLMITGDIEIFPGWPNGIKGPQLMAHVRDQAMRFGTRMITDDIEGLTIEHDHFVLDSASNGRFEAMAVIVATGATASRLPIESEKRLWGRGISACATCDGALPAFRNRELAVIGGGDTACEEALHLTQFGSVVYMVHRSDQLRASKVMQDRVSANPKIKIIWNKVVVEFCGDKFVSCLKVRDTKSGEVSQINVAGAFEAIGHVPNAGFLKGQVELDELNYIKTRPGSTVTSVDGLFAAGDVQDHKYRQAITAAGSGCMAAVECERWLQEFRLR